LKNSSSSAGPPRTEAGSGGTPVDIRVVESLAGIPGDQWNALTDGQPFLRHEFLHALHQTGCASEKSGWLPQYVTLWRDGRLEGALPLYLKTHSYGEYVFDWAWADAYQRHGLAYYPKLLCAVPFSPVSGPRVLAATAADRARLIRSALTIAESVSSLHVLFPPQSEATELEGAGLMLRQGVQFHWRNAAYRHFEEFLGALSHDKRKKIRQERRKVAASGVTFRRLAGGEITAADWRFFIRCYNTTYRAHHSTPYLNLPFFERLGDALGENVLMIIAEMEGRPVASALNLFDRKTLWGRYWGAIGYLPGLHFETCYYQALEFCIERGIETFEGGAQGEHKLSRGFLPSRTWSAHWLKHDRFADAVEQFLQREASGIGRYLDELNERTPFKHPGNSAAAAAGAGPVTLDPDPAT